jgi:hypothetical protein
MLTLSEELYLALHFDEKEASIVPLDPSTSHLVTAGGLVAELFLAGRLRLDETQLIVTGITPAGDALLDEALRRLHLGISFQTNDAEWFNAVAHKLPFGAQMLARLIKKGVIRPLEKRKWFGLSTTTTYPLQDSSITQRWQQLQMDVMVNGRQPAVRDAVLLFMSQAWGIPLPASLSRQEEKTAEKRWQALFGDYWGAYVDQPTEPIPSLDPTVRTAIGHMTVSWATVQASFVAQDIAEYTATMSTFTEG